MESKITYHQQVSYCGKPRCRRCREGIGHGPYWYSYQTINGRTVRSYVGKNPPPEALMLIAPASEVKESAAITGAADAQVRLYVLGQFTLERRAGQTTQGVQHWQTVEDAALQHQRVRSLLMCLISSAGRKLGREQVIDMLWPEVDFETASHRLDKAVHSLRQLFEPGRSRPATSNLLLTEHATLMLAEQSQLWVDADAFEALLAAARNSSDPGKTEQLLEEASLLYGGDYLPEERHIDWITTRRDSLQRSWISLLLELADLRIAREAIPGAIEILDRLLAVDPTNEAAVQRLVMLLAQGGRRGEALRIYHRFATQLKQEYNMLPLPESRALYQAAQRGADLSTIGAFKPAAPGAVKPSVPDTTARSFAATQTGEGETRSYMQIGRSNQSRLVGREKELARLQQLLQDTEQARRVRLAGQKRSTPFSLDGQRQPQCVLLMGDVGIGKTRLAEEMGREARRRGWTVTWTRAYAQETSIPYRMWTETLRKAMAQGLWQRNEIARRPLIYQPLRALLPELEDLLPDLAQSAAPPEQEQLRLWEATRALLTTISENTPLMVVLDDLQWSDSSSCELLAYLVRQLRGHPITIACTCRDSELPANHPLRSILNDLQREKVVETIAVQPLTDDEIRALVSYLPDPIVHGIQRRAAGNPFFAEELARNIEDVGVTFMAPASPANGSDPSTNLPDTIAAVLDLRLNRITPACQRLLVRGAVLGGAFEFATLRAMEARPNVDEDAMLDLLEEALAAGMLTEEGSGTRITYHFWHPLLVSHLYDNLSAGRRANLHRRAAEVLQHSYQGREDEGAATITYHLVNGGASSALITRYAELAGDRAYTLSAYPEAVRHYRLTLEHLGPLAPNASAEACLHRANLLERLGECTRVQGNYEEACRHFEHAVEVRKQYRQAASHLDEQYEAQIDALLWVEIGKTWFDRGDNTRAGQYYSLAEQVLNDANVVEGPAWASLCLQQSYVLWRKGNFGEAAQVGEQTLGAFENVLQQSHVEKNTFHATATKRTLGGDPVDLGRTHLLLGNIAAVIGESTKALVHLKKALTVFEQSDSQREIARVCGNMGDVYLRINDYELAQSSLRRSLGIAERIGDISSLSVAFGNLGILSLRFGDLSDAEFSFRQGLILAEQLNDAIYISLLNGYLGTVFQDQGKLGEGKVALAQALKAGRSIDFDPCIGFALVALGHFRISQAIDAHEKRHYISKSKMLRGNQTFSHFLQRAKGSLQHALALEGLEAETRTDGELALAQVTFLQGEIEGAHAQTQQVMEEAHRYEQTWLLACAQRLMGSILSRQGKYEEASSCFSQSLETLRQCGMRLEEARTQRSFGESLLQRPDANGRGTGARYLQEARQIFEECHAPLDLALTDHLIATQRPKRP